MMLLGEHSSVLRCQPDFAILTARQALFSLRSWGNGSGGAEYKHSLYCHSTASNHLSLWNITLRVTSPEIPLRGLWLISYKHNCQNCRFPKKKHTEVTGTWTNWGPCWNCCSRQRATAWWDVCGTRERPQQRLWYLEGGEDLAELQTSAHGDLGPLNLAGRWGLCQKEGWHPEIPDTELLQPWNEDRNPTNSSTTTALYLSRFEQIFSFIPHVFISSVIFSTYT